MQTEAEMAAKPEFETSGTLARNAGTSVVTVNSYADRGLIKHVRASDGTRLFEPGQEGIVREHLARSLAMRGKHRRTAR